MMIKAQDVQVGDYIEAALGPFQPSPMYLGEVTAVDIRPKTGHAFDAVHITCNGINGHVFDLGTPLEVDR